MTQTFQIAPRKDEANPLFAKLQPQYIKNDSTVGDTLRRRSAPSPAQSGFQRNNSAEKRAKMANSLPKSKGSVSSRSMNAIASTGILNTTADVRRAPGKKARFPLRTVLIIAACFAVLMLLIYSGMQINRLNQEVNELKATAALKENESRELSARFEREIDLTEIALQAEKLGMVPAGNVDKLYPDNITGDTVVIPD